MELVVRIACKANYISDVLLCVAIVSSLMLVPQLLPTAHAGIAALPLLAMLLIAALPIDTRRDCPLSHRHTEIHTEFALTGDC